MNAPDFAAVAASFGIARGVLIVTPHLNLMNLGIFAHTRRRRGAIA